MQKNEEQDNGKNIIVGPDYNQLMKQQTNSAIIEGFVNMLFDKNTKCTRESFMIMIRNIFILLFVKMILEDSKGYLDKFKFTDLNILKYFWQKVKYSEIRYEINLVGGKWKYNNIPISMTTLTTFLEQHKISISRFGTHYYREKNFLIKVIISASQITFVVPNLLSTTRYLEFDVINKNKEIIFGDKTTMFKIVTTNTTGGVLKADPMKISYAFPTPNYEHLERSIRNYFMVNAALKFPTIPYCINFDGEPGTGKTTFASYIASTGIFDRIFICNFVQLSNEPFETIIKHIERIINGGASREKKVDVEEENILIIFDEVDKWLHSHINNQIFKMREEARSSKNTVDKQGNTKMIVSHEKLTRDEEMEKAMDIKGKFLDHLYNLAEGQVLSDYRNYVLIFNTNEFEKIFSDVDTKYLALRDRFQRYHFTKIGKKEIENYLRCIGKRLREYNVQESEKFNKLLGDVDLEQFFNINESIYGEIPEDIEITYRCLHKILRHQGCDIIKTVKSLVEYNKNRVEFLNEINSGKNEEIDEMLD